LPCNNEVKITASHTLIQKNECITSDTVIKKPTVSYIGTQPLSIQHATTIPGSEIHIKSLLTNSLKTNYSHATRGSTSHYPR